MSLFAVAPRCARGRHRFEVWGDPEDYWTSYDHCVVCGEWRDLRIIHCKDHTAVFWARCGYPRDPNLQLIRTADGEYVP